MRPHGSNPCRNIRCYQVKLRGGFLSLEELKRLGFVLDHAEDTQVAAAIRLLLFTGARSSEITCRKWAWTRGTRAVLPEDLPEEHPTAAAHEGGPARSTG